MSDLRSLKDKHPLPPPGAAQASADIHQQVQDACERARDTIAQLHTTWSRTLQLLTRAEEIIRHRQARREYEAEQGILPLATVPRASVDLLLVEDNPADVALFRYVLKECALPCQLTVLSHRSEVEAFFAQATTAASLFLPRLIIADCMIPGMEAEEIVAAVRTVPAYQRVPVILFSILPEAEGQRLSAACGATIFIHKPGELDAFGETVSTMVHRWGGGGEGLEPVHSS